VIVQIVIEAIANIAARLLSIIPGDSTWSASLVTSIDGAGSTFAPYVQPFGAWFPFSAMRSTMSVAVIVFPLCIAIKATRTVISLLTGGGGNAS